MERPVCGFAPRARGTVCGADAQISRGAPVLYAYFVVGVMSSLLMPYEVYFCSSGGIEDNWNAPTFR